MGWPFAVFFGDKTKAELEKELKKVDEKIAELEKEKAQLTEATKAYDSNSKG